MSEDEQRCDAEPICKPGAELPGAVVVWFTGLSAAGKSTLAQALQRQLADRSIRATLLDGDEVRKAISSDLGFTEVDRKEQSRRLGELAAIQAAGADVVLVAAITPFRESREALRRRFPRFLEVFVDAPLRVCEERDPKGLYSRARAGELPFFTGIDSPYEPPLEADMHCRTDRENLYESTQKVLDGVLRKNREVRKEG